MKRSATPVTTTTLRNWTASGDVQLVTSGGAALEFNDVLASGVYPFVLTAPPNQLMLTVAARKRYSSSVSVTIGTPRNWTTDTAEQISDNNGNALLFNDLVVSNAKPISLTAPPTESNLDSN